LIAAGYCVQRVNVDQNLPLAKKYGIESVPSFLMMSDGKEIDRVTGWCSYERLEKMLKRRPAEILAPRHVPSAPPVPSSHRVPLAPPVPHPAWRYERPTGYRAAVVRIFCTCVSGSATQPVRSIGSGALVDWKGRAVVLTARHVTQDAKSIVVRLSTGKTLSARLLSADATWDLAVLELQGIPQGVEPVALEFGPEAMQREGCRLESCGYGPDGRLACNSGLFLGYRRSAAAPRGPDDWMVLSGHAREGDSGGPVFNERGRLVGVLWGTDGESVVAVQAGRLHLTLDAAVATRGQGSEVVSLSPLSSPLSSVVPTAVNVGIDLAANKSPCLPWRSGTQKIITAEQKEIDALISLEKARSACGAGTASATPPACCQPGCCPTQPPTATQPETAKENALSPVLVIVIVLAAFVATGLAFGLTQKKS
jgi:S1-C subfamily serine protease